MIDSVFLSFSFLQGVLAFFAPCAVALLPGYLSNFVTKSKEGETLSVQKSFFRSIIFSLFTITGIVLIYAVAGVMIFTVASLVKSYMVYVAMALGVLVIILGIIMLFGKQISLPFHSPQLKAKSQYVEAFLFGIAYGLGALGCLFPLFLVVATQALQAPNLAISSLYFFAYAVGMSLFMFMFYIIAVFAREALQKWLFKFMPYVLRISGVIIIAAGVYIIWYQSALLL